MCELTMVVEGWAYQKAMDFPEFSLESAHRTATMWLKRPNKIGTNSGLHETTRPDCRPIHPPATHPTPSSLRPFPSPLIYSLSSRPPHQAYCQIVANDSLDPRRQTGTFTSSHLSSPLFASLFLIDGDPPWTGNLYYHRAIPQHLRTLSRPRRSSTPPSIGLATFRPLWFLPGETRIAWIHPQATTHTLTVVLTRLIVRSHRSRARPTTR